LTRHLVNMLIIGLINTKRFINIFGENPKGYTNVVLKHTR